MKPAAVWKCGPLCFLYLQRATRGDEVISTTCPKIGIPGLVEYESMSILLTSDHQSVAFHQHSKWENDNDESAQRLAGVRSDQITTGYGRSRARPRNQDKIPLEAPRLYAWPMAAVTTAGSLGSLRDGSYRITNADDDTYTLLLQAKHDMTSSVQKALYYIWASDSRPCASFRAANANVLAPRVLLPDRSQGENKKTTTKLQWVDNSLGCIQDRGMAIGDWGSGCN
ncbi:hypothetical protein JHW43_008867 [Diplocarpon mali]|nr:hypothetical protein JHW43_008867 [Diplocarpon mali]